MIPVRGVWAGSGEVGTCKDSVAAFADRLVSLKMNAVFMGVKEGDGRICWPSSKFPEIVKPEFREFDMPAILLEECSKRGIACHAWFIDYYEGIDGWAYKYHPEWAAKNRLGLDTTHETLRGAPYSGVWMCPAQRPGYTDQHLVPLYQEFAERYDFASLHHDYIRYPGDLAPDQYCFCDYCLKEIPRWAGFINDVHKNEPFAHELYDRPYLEAHWEQSPRVVPAHWKRLSREFQSDLLLEGSFFQGGRNDLDHFFYEYRIEQINEFARLSYEAVKSANPKIKLSGAIFKNPIHSGRFIGQDWRRFARYQGIAIPMDYRDHFPGTMEHYLDLLEAGIVRQKQWAKDCEELYIGFAIWPLYKEEPNGPYPDWKLERTVERIASQDVDGIVMFCEWDIQKYGLEAAVKRSFGAIC
jgi:uncharacterized lipoprotein YddW (UPF0748 family)